MPVLQAPRQHGRGGAAVQAPVMAGELLTFLCVTLVVHRPRPPVARLDVAPETSSFPSGHTAAAVALYGCIAILVLWIYGRRPATRGGLGRRGGRPVVPVRPLHGLHLVRARLRVGPGQPGPGPLALPGRLDRGRRLRCRRGLVADLAGRALAGGRGRRMALRHRLDNRQRRGRPCAPEAVSPPPCVRLLAGAPRSSSRSWRLSTLSSGLRGSPAGSCSKGWSGTRR